MFSYIKFVVGLLIVSILLFFISGRIELERVVSLVNIQSIFLLSIISVVISILLSLQLFLSFKIFPPKLYFLECLHLVFNNSLVNALLPFKAGLVLRWIYVKKKYKYSIVNYLSNTLSIQLIQLASALILFIFIALIYQIDNKYLNNQNFLIFILTVVLTCTIIFLFKPRLLIKIISALNILVLNWKKVIAVIIIQILFIILSAGRLYLATIFLNINVQFHQILIIQSLLTIILFTNLTIGNLGIKEGSVYIIAASLGVSGEHMVIAALLDRAASLIPIVVIGSYSTYWLKKALKHSSNNRG